MPRVFLVLGSTDVPVVFTNDHPVGLGCMNQRDDVLLIQHLLNTIWHDAGGSEGFQPPGEDRPLVLDGVCGPRTEKFIQHFQQETRNRHITLVEEDRIDPVTGAQPGGSHAHYTILALNAARNSRRQANLMDIAGDPGFPEELRHHFYANW